MHKLVLCVIAVAALALAATPPNLSGKWTLNKDKSEFSRSAPDSMTATITDDGRKIHMVQTVNGNDIELNVERGVESVNHLGDMEMHTKLTVDGDRLLEDTTFNGPQGTLTRKSVITVSADGKTLIFDGNYDSPTGAFHEKIVLDKAD